MDLLLDDVIPHWHRRERHHLVAALPPAAVLSAAETLRWADVPAFHAIVRSVGLGRTRFPADGRVLDMFLGNGFAILGRTDQEMVVGGIERTSRTQPIVPLDEASAVRDWFRWHGESASAAYSPSSADLLILPTLVIYRKYSGQDH